jgi:hypothetical protein
MTLSIKYQEFVSQQVKQLGSQDFDREVIQCIRRMALGCWEFYKQEPLFSTQVSCVTDSTECRFWVTVALAIRMATLQLPR